MRRRYVPKNVRCAVNFILRIKYLLFHVLKTLMAQNYVTLANREKGETVTPLFPRKNGSNYTEMNMNEGGT